MSLFQSIRTPVRHVIQQLLSDASFSEEVVYRRHTGTQFDPALRRSVDTFSETRLRAARLRHNKESVQVASSGIESGDLLFLFDGATFPAGHTTKDLIQDSSGNDFGIKAIDPVFDMAVSVTVVDAR